MNASIPDSEEIDKLLAFLPLFDRPGRKFVKKWNGGEKLSDGSTTFPYPEYEEDVTAFFELVAQPCWSDFNYQPETAADMLGDERALCKGELSEIRTMLTHCMRSERFCDGTWGASLQSGKITSLQKRLRELRFQNESDI